MARNLANSFFRNNKVVYFFIVLDLLLKLLRLSFDKIKIPTVFIVQTDLVLALS